MTAEEIKNKAYRKMKNSKKEWIEYHFAEVELDQYVAEVSREVAVEFLLYALELMFFEKTSESINQIFDKWKSKEDK